MRALVTALFLLLAGPAWAQQVTITADYGGFIHLYQQYVEQLRLRGTQVRIDGPCYSACTMVLSLGNRVCVTPRARLGFHAAYIIYLWGPGDPHPEATQIMMDHYPPAIRQWIAENGGLQREMIYLKGKELRARVRPCP